MICLSVWIREKFGFMYPAARFPTKNCICWRRQMAESALSQVRPICLIMRSAVCSEKISALLMAMKRMTGITVCFKVCSRKARMRSPRKRCNMQMRAKILMNCPLPARSRRIRSLWSSRQRQLRMMRQKSNLFWMYIIWRINWSRICLSRIRKQVNRAKRSFRRHRSSSCGGKSKMRRLKKKNWEVNTRSW